MLLIKKLKEKNWAEQSKDMFILITRDMVFSFTVLYHFNSTYILYSKKSLLIRQANSKMADLFKTQFSICLKEM